MVAEIDSLIEWFEARRLTRREPGAALMAGAAAETSA